ncbi:hypothetical protein NW754_016505 [Fusarium falciforme]|uniref:Uncharacterized protein n=1 Tax=Fusarium falciforme TaxID=195108 RepID=A0A9W8R3T7_9HYPO|nr:hypothetical protein NW754_016505 [Fusarium falciforme]KAJ4184131.1 hypothetical protein NW755_009136 [Fusarium falciforme]KAJ4187891.1 hypothetical protein NW767_012166 [Fusarium falciforme]KAJ4259523.1 hypothetical protein NW757_002846 [Fusarium falciforme]
MSTISFKAHHGSVEPNGPGQSRSFPRERAKILEAPQQETGRLHLMLRYLNDTCSGSGRPVSETLQDPSHVPGARCRISLDDPLYSALSHDPKTAPPHESLLAEVGAQFSGRQQGTVRPAKLDSVGIAS